MVTNCVFYSILFSWTGSIYFSKYLWKNNFGHNLCIYLVHCSHELIKSAFLKHLLENKCSNKLCCFMVDCCHELLRYAFSKSLLYNDCGHKFCIYVLNCSYELVQHSSSKHQQVENTCDHKQCSFMVDGCHELIQYVFSKNLLDDICDYKLCIIWYIVLMNTVWIHFFKVSGHILCINMV